MSKQIQLIDRDPLRRAEHKRVLENRGFQVREFDFGKAAINDLLLNTVNAVVLDYSTSLHAHTPVPSGKRIVEEITDVDSFVPLIVICERCDELEHETCAAADLVLRRPLSPRELTDALVNVLGESLRERAQRKSGYIFAFR